MLATAKGPFYPQKQIPIQSSFLKEMRKSEKSGARGVLSVEWQELLWPLFMIDKHGLSRTIDDLVSVFAEY